MAMSAPRCEMSDRTMRDSGLIICCTSIGALVVLAMALGCDDGRVRLPSAPVAGTVTYRGNPLGVGKIIFVHPSGQTAAADLTADGRFAMVANQGKNRVAVQCYVKPDSSTDNNIGLGPFKSLIPGRYADVNTSGLAYEVKPDQNSAEFVLRD
jgi:hypothetical protein